MVTPIARGLFCYKQVSLTPWTVLSTDWEVSTQTTCWNCCCFEWSFKMALYCSCVFLEDKSGWLAFCLKELLQVEALCFHNFYHENAQYALLSWYSFNSRQWYIWSCFSIFLVFIKVNCVNMNCFYDLAAMCNFPLLFYRDRYLI